MENILTRAWVERLFVLHALICDLLSPYVCILSAGDLIKPHLVGANGWHEGRRVRHGSFSLRINFSPQKPFPNENSFRNLCWLHGFVCEPRWGTRVSSVRTSLPVCIHYHIFSISFNKCIFLGFQGSSSQHQGVKITNIIIIRRQQFFSRKPWNCWRRSVFSWESEYKFAILTINYLHGMHKFVQLAGHSFMFMCSFVTSQWVEEFNFL